MEYKATTKWQANSNPFDVKTFDRSHSITFGSGATLEGSSAPEFLGKANLVNPEELFTASINSCFMLTFLYWAAMRKFDVAQYECEAVGKLGKNAEGKMAMLEVMLKPEVQFNGTAPDSEQLNDLFHKAHDQCFISSSVKTTVTVQQ